MVTSPLQNHVEVVSESPSRDKWYQSQPDRATQIKDIVEYECFLTRMPKILSGEVVVSWQDWYCLFVAWSMYYVDPGYIIE